MSSLFKKVAGFLSPAYDAATGFKGGAFTNALSVLGGPAGAALGSGISTIAGGGSLGDSLKSAALSGIGSGIGMGTPGTSINWTSAAPGYSTGLQTVGGSGLLGAVSRGLGGTGMGQAISSGISGLARGATGAGGGGLAGTIGQSIPTIFSGYQQQQTLRDMERAQQTANQRALATMSPFTTAGQQAQGRLGSLLGLGGETDEEVLQTLQSSPGYQFRLDQGQQALDRSLAARGGLLSGRALIESQRMGQGLADQTYNDYMRSLQQQTGTGLQAARGTAGLQTSGGDIRAAGLAGRQDAMDRTLAALLGQGG